MKKESALYAHCLEILASSVLFSDLDDEVLQNMLLSFNRETWAKHSIAIDSSQTLKWFYVVISGRIKISQTNPFTGREQTLFLLGPGDVFDVICLLDGKEHPVLTTALDDVEALVANINEVRNWIEEHREFNRKFLPYIGNQIRQLENLATDLSLHDTGTRLARVILQHLDYEHPRNKLRLINDLSHKELASLIGSVRSVVNRHVQSLKKEGILEAKRGHMEIKNLKSLLAKVENLISVK